MSILLRTAPLRAARTIAARQQVRMLHVENVVDHALPTSVKNRYWLAAKIITYGTIGFGTPFYAAYFHIQKAAGGT